MHVSQMTSRHCLSNQNWTQYSKAMRISCEAMAGTPATSLKCECGHWSGVDNVQIQQLFLLRPLQSDRWRIT